MRTEDGFTERVRQELSRLPFDQPLAELAGITRLVGRLHRTGTRDGTTATRLEVDSTSGAVVRRVFQLMLEIGAPRPQLWVREAGGLRTRASYGLALDDVDRLVRRLGLVDEDGRPVAGLPAAATADPVVALRAVLVSSASLSRPGQPAHLEVAVPSSAVAVDVVSVFRRLDVAAHADERRDRVVVKSGAAVQRLLELAGATDAHAEVAERRQRRDVRNQATRLANADASNVRRTIEAAQSQLDLIERAVAAVGWSGLGEDLRDIALARMVNPTASLAELGELCEPPVGKSAVHRRLERIARLADDGAPEN